jgi:LysM repeat protein
VAIFPRQYAAYVEQLDARRAASAGDRLAYRVRSGDSLWTIARTHGTTVNELQVANQLEGSRIYAGQVLDVPLD